MGRPGGHRHQSARASGGIRACELRHEGWSRLSQRRPRSAAGTLMGFSLRPAIGTDVPRLEALIARSARALSGEDYRPAQVEAALRGTFGVDSQLLRDGTYFA